MSLERPTAPAVARTPSTAPTRATALASAASALATSPASALATSLALAAPTRATALVAAALWVVCSGCGAGPRAVGSSAEGGAGPSASRLLELVGFPDRSDWSSTVLHMDAEEIGGRPRLSALLRQSERVRLGRAEGTEWGVRLVDEAGENPCGVAVYINGSRYGRAERPGSRVGLDDLIAPSAIAGMELHAGPEGPLIPGLDCAALLIWSLEADPVYGFLADITATVEGAAADRVASVVLYPGPREGRREGRSTFFSVLPGEYEVHFLGADGRALDVRRVRAWAFAESEVSLEVNEGEPDLEGSAEAG